MPQSAAGDFVNSLRDELYRKKNKIKGKRNILQDSVNLISEIFSAENGIEIRSTRNFEIDEIATYLDVYVQDNFIESISKIFNSNKITYLSSTLNDYKCVFVIDLEDKIRSSGNSKNLFSLEVVSKRLKTYKVKISLCDDFCYSIFDSIYHEIKFWYYLNNNLYIGNFNLRGLDRSKKKIKISDIVDGLDGLIYFSESGQLENVNLFPSKRKKNKESLYNTLNLNTHE